MSGISEKKLERVTKTKNQIASNIRTHRRTPLPISDILLIEALSGGKLKINGRRTASPLYLNELEKLEESLKTSENIIFSSSESINGSNLLIGEAVDVKLYPGEIHSTVLRNIELLIAPEKYREIKDTRLKKGSVCQKLLELDKKDIIDTVFKINSFRSRAIVSPTPVRSTEDLLILTDEDDFILLLSDDLAFMVAAIDDGRGSPEQRFYLINSKKNAKHPVTKLNDYSILSLYITTPELRGN